MKMSDVFLLPVTTMSLAYNTASDESNTVILDAVAHAINQHDKLVDALRRYVETDEVNMCDPGNQFWIDGKNRAVELLSSEDNA